MNFEGLKLIFRILLIAISFAGLCGIVNRRFRIDGTIAPFVSACGIIVLLMLGGMAGILPWIWWGLFVGGLSGFVYYICKRIIDKRERNDKYGLIPVFVLAMVLLYGFWRFNGVYYGGNDSISHWGLASKYLLLHDSFPDSSTELIFFPSYPLGSACFIYYFCRFIGPIEGFALYAQFMLDAICFLPVLSIIKRNRIAGWILSGISFLFMVTYNIGMDSLQVDSLLAFIALGGTVSICFYQKDRARVIALSALTSVILVFTKSSGVFFSVAVVVYTLCLVRLDRKSFLKTGIILIGITVLAFVFWNLHVKSAYVGGLSTKHAVSLTGYAQTLSEKSDDLILLIAGKMVKRLIKPNRDNLLLLGLAVVFFSGMKLLVSMHKEERNIWMRRLNNTALVCIILYTVWYVMLFLMYVFSMPVEEAQRLATISRYERTAQIYIIGIVLLFALCYFCREDYPDTRVAKWGVVAVAALSLCGIMAVSVIGNTGMMGILFSKIPILKARECAFELRDRYEIENEKRYLVFSKYKNRNVQYSYYLIKYEFMSNDIMMIMDGVNEKGLDPNLYYTFQNASSDYIEYAPIENMQSVFSEHLDRYDYLLVLDKDPVFEEALNEFLETYEGDAQIMYAY